MQLGPILSWILQASGGRLCIQATKRDLEAERQKAGPRLDFLLIAGRRDL
jgi:hypothetical protein